MSREYLKNEIFRANREKIDRFMAYIKENAEKKSLDAAVHKMIFDIKEKSNAQEFQDFVEIIGKNTVVLLIYRRDIIAV